ENGEFGMGGKSGKKSGDKSGATGQGGQGQGSGNGMGGPGQGQGGTPEFGTVDESAKAEVARGKLDPKGRISVTTFKGLPKPGELTPEIRAALRAANDDA